MDKPKYLYHGSSKRLEILSPHQAEDFLNPAGSQYGVWATSNRDVALAFALGAAPDETGGVTRIMQPQDLNPVKMVYVQGHPNFGGKGYLYTVSSNRFEHVAGEVWICREPVIPLETLEIHVDDYLHLFRYATEEKKRAIQSESGAETEASSEGPPNQRFQPTSLRCTSLGG
jgi:hypothetical protein